MTLPHGVIIAGGRGERLGGVRKAEIRIGGTRLIERVVAAIGPLAGLIVAVGPAAQEGRVPPASLPRKMGRVSAGGFGGAEVSDLESPVGGPLAGLAAAVGALQARGIAEGLLVSVAVDTPFLPEDFVQRLLDGIGEAPCAYAAWGDEFYPPNALWRLEALRALPAQVSAGQAPKSLKALQHGLSAVAVGWPAEAANPFANVNRVADLVALGRRAQNRGPSPLIHKRGN